MSTPSAAREQQLVAAFGRLADTLVADYDVIDLCHGLCGDCVALLGADAAGLVLTDQRGPRVPDAPARADHRRGEPLPPQPRDHGPDDLAVGQAPADVATIAILSDRNIRERDRLTEQLQAALTRRVIIEQAKGMLAERGQFGLDEAFTRLRTHARTRQRRLSDLARAVIDGSLDTDPLLR